MSKPSEQIDNILCECIDQLEGIDTPLSAELLAQCAQEKLDPSEKSPWLVRYSSNMNLRQQARNLLRGKYDPVSTENKQIELFENLQNKYPVQRTVEDKLTHCYIPLEQMLPEDFEYNFTRMEREIATKQKHLDALKAYYLSKMDEGLFESVASDE